MKKILITSTLVLLSVLCFSQNSKKDGKFDWDRVTVGGGVGLSFGSQTYINVSPEIGYYLIDKVLITGVGFSYIYYEVPEVSYKTNVYGGKIFGEFLMPKTPLVAHSEVEVLNYDAYVSPGVTTPRTETNLWLGGGIRQQISPRSFLSIIALWNLNEDANSFTTSPVIRGGITIAM